MALFSTFLLLMTMSECYFAENIGIERGVSFPTDDFLLPTSLCPSFRPLCNKFNAHQLGGCWCNCPQASSFYEHEFKCVLATEARKNAGMAIICVAVFSHENVSSLNDYYLLYFTVRMLEAHPFVYNNNSPFVFLNDIEEGFNKL